MKHAKIKEKCKNKKKNENETKNTKVLKNRETKNRPEFRREKIKLPLTDR